MSWPFSVTFLVLSSICYCGVAFQPQKVLKVYSVLALPLGPLKSNLLLRNKEKLLKDYTVRESVSIL